jgi:hypothetical protein
MHAFSVMLATEDDEDDVSNVQMRELRNKKAKVCLHPSIYILSIYLAVCLSVCLPHIHICIQEDWSRRVSAEVSVVPSAPRHVAFDLSNMPVIEVTKLSLIVVSNDLNEFVLRTLHVYVLRYGLTRHIVLDR